MITNFLKKYPIDYILVFFLIFSLFFTFLIELPIFKYKIQFTEIIFFFLLFNLPIQKSLLLLYKKHKSLFIILFVFLLLDIFNAFKSNDINQILETIGKIYLFLLFTTLYTFFSNISLLQIINLLRFAITCATYFIFLNLLFGIYQIVNFNNSKFFILFHNYPYFGTIFRFRSFTIHPNMLNNLISVFTIFMIGTSDFSKKKFFNYIFFLISFIIILSTFSKSVPLFLMGCTMLFFYKYFNRKTFFIYSTILIFLIIQLLSSHLIFAPKSSELKESLKTTDFSSDKILFETNNFYIIETGYLTLKKIEIDLFLKNPFFGIGSGKFNSKLDYYRFKNIYPQKMPNFDPHSTYFGLLAENGLIQFLLLFLFLILLIRIIVHNNYFLINNTTFSSYIILILFIIEGISTDILNFRHFWVFISLALVVIDKKDEFRAKFSIHG